MPELGGCIGAVTQLDLVVIGIRIVEVVEADAVAHHVDQRVRLSSPSGDAPNLAARGPTTDLLNDLHAVLNKAVARRNA